MQQKKKTHLGSKEKKYKLRGRIEEQEKRKKCFGIKGDETKDGNNREEEISIHKTKNKRVERER